MADQSGNANANANSDNESDSMKSATSQHDDDDDEMMPEPGSQQPLDEGEDEFVDASEVFEGDDADEVEEQTQQEELTEKQQSELKVEEDMVEEELKESVAERQQQEEVVEEEEEEEEEEAVKLFVETAVSPAEEVETGIEEVESKTEPTTEADTKQPSEAPAAAIFENPEVASAVMEATKESTIPKEVDTSSPSSSSKAGSGGNGNGSNKFYTIFDSIQQNIETLDDATKELEKVNDRFVLQASAISPAEESALIKQVSGLINSTNQMAKETKRLIKQLRVESKNPAPAAGSEYKSADEKSEEEKEEESRDMGDRENICKNITRSFTDELMLYQSGSQDFKNELKERLTKRIQGIRPSASEEFVDLSLRSESSRYALFREIMSMDEKDLSEREARALKDEIAEKYLLISEISRSCAEVNKIFLTLRSTDIGIDSDDDSQKSKEKKKATQDPLFGSLGGASSGSGSSNSAGLSDSSDPPSGAPRRSRLMQFINRQREQRKSRRESQKQAAAAALSGGSVTSEGSRSSRHSRFSYAEARKHRPRRGRRLMALFLLATVAIAAMMGIVMMH